MEKMWAVLVHLSKNMWQNRTDTLYFDEDVWNHIIENAAKSGLNTVVLDVGDAVQYKSYPEISVKNAWSEKKVHEEVKKCRELGLELIPKLNFSTGHSMWLKEYHRMISSSKYYDVCKNLIDEVYDMFEAPKYFQLGMDEETAFESSKENYVIFRKGDLLMHDIKFLIDEVKSKGAMPWIWADPFLYHTENYKKYISADDAILSPWYYYSFKKEHYIPLKESDRWNIFGHFIEQGFEFAEDLSEATMWRQLFKDVAVPEMKNGFKYVPTVSVWANSSYNTEEMVEYFKENACTEDNIVGFMTAPWRMTTKEDQSDFDWSFKLLKEAREKFYK